MENSVKSVQTSKKGTLYLILFIIVLLVGLGLIITGFVMNKSMRDSFVPPLENPKAKYQPGWYILVCD